MGGEVLVHLEHAHLFLAENVPEFIVSQNFTAVPRVLQVVRADVLSHLADYLAPGQRSRPDDCSKLLGWLERLL